MNWRQQIQTVASKIVEKYQAYEKLTINNPQAE
jgi:hypothetical protein